MSDSTDKTETDPREGRTQRQIIWLALALIGLAMALGFVFTMRVSSPDGAYYGGHGSYDVFTNGVVVRIPGHSSYVTYTNENGQWVLYEILYARGSKPYATITPTALGIYLRAVGGSGNHAFMFRRNFAWIPKTKEWLQAHGLWKED